MAKSKVIIIQARMGSARLPGKVMKNLAGRPMLWHVAARCRRAKADKVVVATTAEKEDVPIAEFCQTHNFLYYRGSSEDVLERYYMAAKEYRGDIIVRVTGDCPLIEPEIIDDCAAALENGDYDYISNVVPGKRTFPRGLDVEVFTFSALERAQKNAAASREREHVTPYLWETKKDKFKIGPIITASPKYARNYRLTVDYPEDFALMEKIYHELYKEGDVIRASDALKFLDAHPEAAKINEGCEEKHLARIAAQK